MPCLQWTIGSGGLAVPGLQARRIPRPRGAVRAGLRQWGGKMEWNGTEKRRTGKGAEGDTLKAAASMSSGADDADAFCIIEGRDTVMDFAQMDLQEIREHITRRRNKIFLLMEEVRRLRIQHKIKSTEKGIEDVAEDEEMPEYTSAIPLLAPMTEATLQQYFRTCLIIVAGIVLFGGLIAPVLELKLGLGGTSYKDFIQNMHLPMQLSEVDPIVASFSGGAVGVITSLMVVELNNVKRQEKQRCRYCHGTGYLACARCAGSGSIVAMENGAATGASGGTPTSSQRCPNCAGATKVMCPTCLCTGMALASEHDPRIDPFQLTSLLEVRPIKRLDNWILVMHSNVGNKNAFVWMSVYSWCCFVMNLLEYVAILLMALAVHFLYILFCYGSVDYFVNRKKPAHIEEISLS